MATAIRQVSLSSPFEPLDGLGTATRCMVVFRWHRRVVGRTFLPVHDGHIGASQLASAARAIRRDARFVWMTDAVGYDERDLLEATRATATIAICTRERPDDLERALDALRDQTHRGHDTIVVDNAPRTDRTQRVVARYADVRYVCEPAVGLNAARNRAVREARGAIIAFTDDDAVPEPEWLENLLRNFADARVQLTTGLILPLELESVAQELFEEVSPFERGFRRRIFDGQHDNPFAVGRIGAGASMAVRRQLLVEVGGFDERLDGGMPTRSGGDHDMFIRALLAGYRIAYDPAAVSWHRHRRTHAELVDTIYGYGVGVYALWTGMLLERREVGMARMAWGWFRAAHLPELKRTLSRRPPTPTSALARAELRGCLHGPRAWFAARRMRPTGGLR